MTTSGPQPHQVVAVYADNQSANLAAEAARKAGATEARVGGAGDDVVALRAEMRAEMDNSMAAPASVGPFPKEAAKGVTFGVLVGSILGALLVLPLGFVDFGLPLWQRLLIAAAVGASGGATVGFVIGGGVGVRGPAEPLAAEEGVTVVALTPEAAMATVERAMQSAPGLIRIDVAAQDQPVETVAEGGETFAHTLGRKVVQGEGDWSRVQSNQESGRSGSHQR